MQLLHTLLVAPQATLQRIDVFLSTKLRKFSRNKIRNLTLKKAIIVNGIAVDADYKVQYNDTIEIFAAYKEFNDNVTPEEITLDIIYEDDSFIIINKPQGMPIHKGLGNFQGTLLNALAYYFQSRNIQINIEEGSVHRLDKGTSGLIVFAKNKSVRKHLENQIQNKIMVRKYCALVWGLVKQDEGIIDVPIGRNPENPMLIQAFPLRDEGKEATTNYIVLERYKLASLVQCTLLTGRTHQIRIHFQYIGHAILGDPRYPNNFTFKEIRDILEEEQITQQFLHAQFLEFNHPVSGERCSFEAPLTTGFVKMIDTLCEM